jgi:signal transduction histidine kinase
MAATLSIKRKVIVTVISLCLVSIAVLVFFVYWYQMHQLRAGLRDQAKNEGTLFYTILAGDAEGLARAHIGLDRLDPLLRLFAAGDKDALLAAARPLFEYMRLKDGITHMYFIEPDGRVLLRVHKPEDAGDVIRRATFNKAKATQQLTSGIELGMNFFSLRSVNPVWYQGRLIGYLEVAEEIDHVFSQMKRITGTEVSLFLTAAYVASQRTNVRGERSGAFTILYPTQKEVALRLASTLQPEMQAALHKPQVTIVRYRGAHYAVGIGPIQDADGATVGVLFSHRDVTPLFSMMWASVAAYAGMIVVILLSSLFLLYLSLRKSFLLFRTLKQHIASVTTTWDLSKDLAIPAHDEIGELASEFNVMTDRLRLLTMELEQRITDKEQMLIHQSRMAAMGEMIGCIAHQWRQPLNTLNLIVQELPVYHRQGQLTEEHLAASTSLARELIAHMSQTVEDFRSFFRPGKEKVWFSAKDVLERTLKLMRADFREQHIEPEIIVEDDSTSQGFPNEYGQVLLNILRNVSDVFVERKVTEPRLVIRLFKENDRSVMTITDNAGGIPEEIIDRIFDPYFTTKGPEKGTGLGLYMSKTIVEKNMGGRLTVRNTADGADFRIEV